MPRPTWEPLEIKQGGTGGTTPFSARRALGISDGASTGNCLFAGDMSQSALSATNTKVVTDMLALAETKGSKIVLMPAGLFDMAGFTAPVANPFNTDLPAHNITLRGAGDAYTINAPSSPGPATILRFTSGVTSGAGSTKTYGIYASAEKTAYFTVEDFMIDGNSAIDYGARITNKGRARRIAVSRCITAGLRGQCMDGTIIEDVCCVANIGDGAVIEQATVNDGSNIAANTSSRISGLFESNGGSGLVLKSLLGSSIRNCTMQNNTSYGLELSAVAGNTPPAFLHIDTIWLENNGGAISLYQILSDSTGVSPEVPTDIEWTNIYTDPLAGHKTMHIVKGERFHFNKMRCTATATLRNIDLESAATQIQFTDRQGGFITDLGTLNGDDDVWTSWTPSVGGTATYTNQYGRRIIRGKKVTVVFDITINTIGTGSTTTLSGLLDTVEGTTVQAGCVSFWSGLAVNVIFLGCYGVTNTKTIIFTSSAAASAAVTNGPAIFGNGARVVGTMEYETA